MTHPAAVTASDPRGNHYPARLSTEALIRQARKILGNRANAVSPARLNKICRKYHDKSSGLIDFGTYLDSQLKPVPKPEGRRVLGYRDPTGEMATRNVDRARKGRA